MKTHLLRVCHPIEDESFLGFLIRLAEVNHYERPGILNQIAQSHKYISQPRIALTKELHLGQLSKMTGIDEEKIRMLTYPDISDNGMQNLFAGHKVGRSAIKVSHAKICPKCLTEKPYMRKIWDLAAYTTCAIHNVRLINVCPSCNKKISWARGKVTECSCGFDFTNANLEAVTDDEAAFSRHIFNIVYNMSEKNQGALAHLSLGELLRFIDFMAAQMADITNAGGQFLHPRTLSEIHNYVVEAYKVFCDWPSNFNQFLNNLRDKPRKRLVYQRKTGIVKELGPFYIPLYRHFSQPEYDFIRKSFEDYLIEWDGGYLRESDMAFSERLRRESRYVGINEAARLLEMAPKRIRRLLEAGYLQGSSVVAGKTTLYRIEKLSLNTLKAILDNKLSQNDVAKKLGVTIETLRRLAEADLVRPLQGKTISNDDYEWVYLPQHVDGFLNKIRAAVKESDEGVRTVTLAEVIQRSKVFKYSYLEIISDILLGNLNIYGESLNEGLGSIVFNADEIDELIKTKSIEAKAGASTLEEAAESLQVKTKSLRIWANKGFLVTLSGRNRQWSITSDQLESFKDKYVITAPIARFHGMAPGKLVKILDSLGIHPVSDQYQYLFLKEDVEKAGLDCSVAWEKDSPYRSWKLTKKLEQERQADERLNTRGRHIIMDVKGEPKISRNKGEVKNLKKLIREIFRHDEMQEKRRSRTQLIDEYQIRLF